MLYVLKVKLRVDNLDDDVDDDDDDENDVNDKKGDDLVPYVGYPGTRH